MKNLCKISCLVIFSLGLLVGWHVSALDHISNVKGVDEGKVEKALNAIHINPKNSKARDAARHLIAERIGVTIITLNAAESMIANDVFPDRENIHQAVELGKLSLPATMTNIAAVTYLEKNHHKVTVENIRKFEKSGTREFVHKK